MMAVGKSNSDGCWRGGLSQFRKRCQFACTNMAEECFSRLRRAEIGIRHYIAGSYLLWCAQESSGREDNRRFPTGIG